MGTEFQFGKTKKNLEVGTGNGRTGPPRWLSGKDSVCQCRRCRTCGFNP